MHDVTAEEFAELAVRLHAEPNVEETVDLVVQYAGSVRDDDSPFGGCLRVDLVVAELAHFLDELRGDAVDAEGDQVVVIESAVAEAGHLRGLLAVVVEMLVAEDRHRALG